MLSASRPTVLGLDDVQLSDPSTWDALIYLGRNPVSARLLVAVGMHLASLQAEGGVGRTLGLLLKDGLAEEIRLGPLEPEALGALVRSALSLRDPELATWLATRTRGIRSTRSASSRT